MKFVLKIGIAASRDPDINPFTLTEYVDFGIELPSPQEMRAEVQKVMDRWEAAWPFKGMKHHGHVIVDIEVIPLHIIGSALCRNTR